MNVMRAAQRLDADLDEDAGGSLMLSRAAWISRGTWRSFDSTRRARSVLGRVGEERLRGQARRQDVGVEVRVALPGTHALRARTAARGCSTTTIGVLDLLDRSGSASTGMASSRRAKPARALRCASIAGRRKSSSRSSWTWTPSSVALVGCAS